MSPSEGVQEALFGPTPRRRRAAAGGPAEGTGPVATVVVDVPLPHLDHPFSYAVPANLVDRLRSGARVVVPFAGRSEDGWVVALADGPVAGLRPLKRVVTPDGVLSAEVADLARAVADATGGTRADVLRAAVPPRHAAAEKALRASRQAAAGAPVEQAGPVPVPDAPWDGLIGGAAFLQRTRAGLGPRAAVRLPLDADPWHTAAVAVRAALDAGRGAVVVLPDVHDVEACAAAVRALVPAGQVALLHADLGPSARWREFLRVRDGEARVVLGTRSAVFAPVTDLGLVLVWDDGDDSHVEPHAPGWDSALVALLRAEATGASLALVSRARTVRTQWWVRTGRVKDVAPDRARRRAGAPRVVVPDPADPLEVHARVPRAAHRVAAEALAVGPVLVSVPRVGYASALQCRRCRHGARCPHCAGPLAVPGAGTSALVCRWCARTAERWVCGECGGTQVRAGVVGVTRSAEEWGRAFPGTPVLSSRGGSRAGAVDDAPRVVVATPGTEPPAAGGYAAALVLDGDLALSRRGLAVEEETLRRWLAVAALVRPADAGGRVVVVADRGHRVVQALVQDAPEALADRLCDERDEVGLPPARTVARLLGEEADLAQVAAGLRHEDTLLGAVPVGERPTVLGPAPTEDGTRWQLLASGEAPVVLRTVRDLLATRSMAKAPGRLVVRVDPHDLD